MKNLRKTTALISIFLIISVYFNMLNFETMASATSASKEIEKSQKKNPELVSGYGLKLNNSPDILFKSKSNGKIEATIKDGTGIKTIKTKNNSTKKVTEKTIENKKTKEYKSNFTAPKKEKSKIMTYTANDVTGKTSIFQIVVKNEKGKNSLDVSTRVSFSYANNTLNVILEDYAGIDRGKATLEVIDLNNNNKSIVKVSAKNMKIKKAVKYDGKNIYGIYKIDINKITKNSSGNYYIQVNTTDASGILAVKTASFTVEKTTFYGKIVTLKKEEEELLVPKTKKDIFIEKLEKRLSKIDSSWKYSQNPHWSKKTTNCSRPVSYALRDMGVLKSGQVVWISSSNKIKNENKLKKGGMKGYSGSGETATTLIKNEKLKRGDIIFWKGSTHTSVYAGDNKFYDCGSSATRNKHYVVNKLKPRKVNTNHKVFKYYRFKN